MSQNQQKIVIRTPQEGFFEIQVVDQNLREIYRDAIASRQRQIVLDGFSPEHHQVRLTILEWNNTWEQKLAV